MLAAMRAERVLAAVAMVMRLGSLVLLPIAVLTTTAPPAHRWVLTVAAAVAAAQAVTVSRAYLRGGVRAALVVPDVLAIAVTLAATSSGAVTGGTGGQSPMFHYAVIAVVVAGLPDWSVWRAAAVVGVPALVTIGSATQPHTTYPLWIAVPDALGMVGSTVVVWVIAQLIRRSATGYDRQHALAVSRAQQLALERERARQASALRHRLLSTLDEVLASGMVADASLAVHLRGEVRWLREVIATGLPGPGTTLLAGLRELVAEKETGGLRVALTMPDIEPPLDPPVCDALLGAAREALTNVHKHAGTSTAAVAVTVLPDATLLEIVDEGRGYDPDAVPAGTGLGGSIAGRLGTVGGTAQVVTRPGTGTRVTLRVPA